MDKKIISKIINSQDPWMLAEDIPDVDFHFTQIFLSAFVNNLEKTVGKNYQKTLSIYHGHNLKFYYGEKDSREFSEHVLKLITKNPRFGEKINREIESLSKKFKDICARIDPDSLKKSSNRDLMRLHENLDALHTKLYTWGWLPNAADMFHNNFTDFLKKILENKISRGKINEVLVALSTSLRKSIVQEEHESFLRLVVKKQEKIPEKNLELVIKKHLSKYFYLKHLWLGKEGVYDKTYYLKEIEKFVKKGKQANEVLAEEKKNLKDAIRKRKKLAKKMKLTKKEIRLFDVYSEFAVTKLIRRDAQIFWAYKMNFFFSELSRRFRIPGKLVRFMLPQEIYRRLSSEKLENQFIELLKKRSKHCVYFPGKGKEYILSGREAEKIEKSIVGAKPEMKKELTGQAACLGKGRGRVKIINLISDMSKMKKSDILVSLMTNPDIVPAMKKASAVVTEQGDITSHAAIISRELGTPCIIGVKNATKILKDGDMVEVDANRGTVKIAKQEKR